MIDTPQKPRLPPMLEKTIQKLDLRSTLLLQGFLLDHALKLMGIVDEAAIPKKSIIEL